MTPPATPSRSERDLAGRRRAKRRSAQNKILLALALVIAFGFGIALGQALHDNPRPGGMQTSFRTLPPLTQTRAPG